MTSTQAKNNFPSHFVPQSEKIKPEWCLAYMKAFDQESAYAPTDYGILRNNKNYSYFKQLARGENPTAPFKELMGLKKAKGKLDTSFRNIDFKMLKIGPKIKNVLTNKIINVDYNINVKPVDPGALSARRSYKSKLLEMMVSEQEMKRFEMLTKLGLERPIAPGEQPPVNSAEIEPFMDMNPRNTMAMEVKDYLTWNFYKNNWSQLQIEIISDLIDFGIGGTMPYVDRNGFVAIKKIDPERSVCNKCKYPDFRDLIRFGHYSEITISELRALTKGSLGPEEVYKDIANKACGEGARYNGNVTQYWNASSYSYAYDVERCTIFEAIWFSTDTETKKVIKNAAGNTRVIKEEFNYVPFLGDKKINDGKGMSDAEYNKANPDKKIYREETKNVYKGTWIVGTNHIYNYGLFDNMPRSVSNLWETELPVCMISTDFISTMSILEQGLNQAQLNYLQYQSHMSASKPPGIAIEKKALARVAVGGKGGKKFDPKEDLMLYAESGNIIYDGYDAHGNPLNHKPFEELKNGLSPGAVEHFQLILQWIDFMRTQVGLNAMTEGQAPPERMGKAVAQLSFGASDNALSHLKDAFRKIYEKTSRTVFSMFQASMQGGWDLSETLGSESMQFFRMNNDIALKDIGIMIQEGPDEYLREKISLIAQRAIDAGEIDGSDGIYIEMESNIYRALLLLAKKKRERDNRKAAEQERMIRAQGEENTKTAVETQKAKAEADQQKIQAEQANIILKGQIEDQAADKKFLHDVIIKKIDNEKELEQTEQTFVLEMLKLNTPKKAA